ncbi:tRNA methyl transferase-domain-containing protein [Boletus edulis]|uniref:tRNA-5-taurinomethyluridine 2-sulfurtransferase n=1 Tax=Boletus edulis BED1 TaxID=1328754 RepID=A0AAD4BFD7_BOLED|nr:tRNA methyl transferase-domain-containing protein [Boletus edulis]KAF8425006.1 tRNA methyl transferase-domain-containing protein [Boletus edulis BED1]
MSGGVDSSVTAKLLADPSNEYDLSAVFMRNWDTRDESGSDDGCEWKKDWEDVQRVCRMLDIPVKMIDLSREYWLRVFEPSLRDWASGLSPNPDVWCNKEVKFGALLDRLTKDSAFSNAWLATGHYARKTWDTSNRLTQPRPMLRKPLDSTKDQTYYLSSISENSLSRALFPLSQLTKAQLPTATRDESMGLCFVGERKRFGEFISQYIVPKPGPIVDMTTSEKAGVHQGLWNYTIGQGAKISGMPQRMFVAKKDPRANIIFVVPGADHPALYVEGIRVRDFHWIWADGEPPEVSRPSGLEAHIAVHADHDVYVDHERDSIRKRTQGTKLLSHRFQVSIIIFDSNGVQRRVQVDWERFRARPTSFVGFLLDCLHCTFHLLDPKLVVLGTFPEGVGENRAIGLALDVCRRGQASPLQLSAASLDGPTITYGCLTSNFIDDFLGANVDHDISPTTR